MISSVLVAYYLHQLAPPSGYRYYNPPSSVSQRVLPANTTSLTVQGQAIERSTAIAPGSQRVLMSRVRLSADCTKDIEVYSIDLQRTGLGNKDDISSLYILQNGSRIASPRQISQKDGTVSFSLRQLIVPACSETVLDVFADFDPASNPSGLHSISVISAQASSPATIKTLQTAVLYSPTTQSQRGTIEVEYRSLNTSVRYGSNRTVSRFLLHPDKESDHMVYGITLTNQGSAKNDNLQRLYLESSGRRVTLVTPRMNDDSVYLEFVPPLLLRKNTNRLFSLKADVRSGIAKSIQFLIEEPSDIAAVPYTSREN